MTQPDLRDRTIRDILLNDWDPIGVRSVAGARDEYDQYIKPIATMLAAGQPMPALSDYLLGIETRDMGLKGNRDRARLVAEKLGSVRHRPR